MWQCIVRVPAPAAPSQCGSALQEFQCPPPRGSEAPHCRNCTAHCPQAVKQCITRLVLPTAPSHCGSASRKCHCPLLLAVRHCIAGVPLPTAPMEGGSALHELRCALPLGSVAVHCTDATTHYPQAVGQRITEVALPTAPKQCGNALQAIVSHCPHVVRQFLVGWAVQLL